MRNVDTLGPVGQGLRAQDARARSRRNPNVYGFRRRRIGPETGLVLVAVTIALAVSGGWVALGVAYAVALFLVICGLAVFIPVVVVWSFLEEARSDAKGATGWVP